VVSIRLATSRDSFHDYIQKTLLYHSETRYLEPLIESSLTSLESLALIKSDGIGNCRPTDLGKAIVASSLDPDDGIFIHKELKRALQAFVMDGDMHALYSFTPVQDFGMTVNWQVFRNAMEDLDESDLRVLGLLGLKPTVINKLAQGGALRESTDEEKETARVYRRFYLALQLRDLCNEVPVHVVARKYDMPRGTVQSLAHNCHTFAAGMVKFCEHMGWGVMAIALDHLSDRLRAGAGSDLLALAQITFVKSRTARVFWDNGYRTVAAIANADPNELVPILMQVCRPSRPLAIIA
jgi:replicative superfamily II helicase